ncbi:LPXTG-motif_cell wall anchor domain [Hexamita inflata]|uniref:LPXTG-motif cell wall anchor domain n=1 Tax=Hexamita inflata TaxID=28002 RepID=A0AA86UHP6_9EUKA|nr:LPXTG-motif cell wall anchor domain [Hexamita inflata]
MVTNNRIFVLGECQFEGMCQKTDNNLTTLILPTNLTADYIDDVVFYPDTIVIIRQTDNTIFVLGTDHCSKTVHKSWHLAEFSQAEQIFFGKKVTIFSQNDSVFVCGFQGVPDGVMVPISHQAGTVKSVAANGDGILIAGTDGLFVMGDNVNNVLGKCEELTAGVCQPQILAQVPYDQGNQIQVVEGLSTVLIFIAYPHQNYYSNYDPQAIVDSVYQAGNIIGNQKAHGFNFLSNAAQFNKIKGNDNGFIALSPKGVMWTFGNHISYESGFQYPIQPSTPIPIPFFQDHEVISYDYSNTNGIALTTRNWLYTFGQNTNGNLGKTLYEFDQTLTPSGPKKLQLNFLLKDETMQQVGVVKNVYFVRTNMRVLYWGLCEGQCGVDAAGKIIFDKEDVDRSEVRVMNLKFKVDHFDTFTDQIVLISTDKKVFGYGLNNLGQLCQPISSNHNGSTADSNIKLSGVHYFQMGEDKSLIHSNKKLYFCGNNIMANGKKVLANSQKDQIDSPMEIQFFDDCLIKDVSVQKDMFLVLTDKGLFAKGYVPNPEEYGIFSAEIDKWLLITGVDVSKVNHILSVNQHAENGQTYVIQDDSYVPINVDDIPEEEEEEQPAEEEEEQPGEEEEEQDNKTGMPGWEIAVITIASIAGVGIIAAIIAIYMKKKNVVNNYKNIAEVHDEFERQ